MSNFDQVLDSLKSERNTVQRELQQIDVRRTQLLHDSKRIEKAIAALTDSKKKTPALKAPSFEIFRQNAVDILGREEQLTDIELKKRIRAALRNAGFSAAGLTGFFGELLKDERLEIKQNQFSIRKELPQDSSGIT